MIDLQERFLKGGPIQTCVGSAIYTWRLHKEKWWQTNFTHLMPEFFGFLEATIWFWSVSFADQSSGQFFISWFFLSSLFWKCGFGQSLGRPIVQSISHFLKKTGQKIQESEQKRSETGQIFFWSTKKMRNRPDNWSTKKLTKSTWTPLKSQQDP